MLLVLPGTGEHGVGVGKKEYLVRELGAGTVQLMRTIKRVIDPDELFNPGKVTGTARCVDLSLTAELYSCTPTSRLPDAIDCIISYNPVSFFLPCWPACEPGRCCHMR